MTTSKELLLIYTNLHFVEYLRQLNTFITSMNGTKFLPVSTVFKTIQIIFKWNFSQCATFHSQSSCKNSSQGYPAATACLVTKYLGLSGRQIFEIVCCSATLILPAKGCCSPLDWFLDKTEGKYLTLHSCRVCTCPGGKSWPCKKLSGWEHMGTLWPLPLLKIVLLHRKHFKILR